MDTPESSSFRYLPLEQLQPSPLNPRKRFDETRLRELAESFKGVGIIEPLVARPVNGHFEIVCGDRRSRAARLANLETVPVIVKDLDDAQVLEIMVIENNQREDVNPLEEADGLQRLLRTGYDIDKMADRIGRSRKYIYDRVKLLDLVPQARDLLLEDRFTAGHAILLARLKPAEQARALEGGAFTPDVGAEDEDEDQDRDFAGMKPRSVRELKSWIERHVRFDVAHMGQAVPFEFGEVAQQVQQAAAKPGRGKKVIAITFDHGPADDAKDLSERTYGASSWRRADGTEGTSRLRGYGPFEDSPTCEHSVLGVVTTGTQHYGKTFQVCVARDRCQVHWKKEIAEREKNAKLRESGKGHQAARNESKAREDYQDRWKREQQERDRKNAAWDLIRERALAALAAKLKESGPDGRVLEALQKTFRIDRDDRPLFDKLMGAVSAKNIAIALLFAAILDDAAREFTEFARVVKPFGVELKALETEYRAALTPAPAKVATPAPVKKKPAKPVQTSAKPKTKKKARGKKR